MKRLGDDILTPIDFLTKKQRKRIVLTWISINDRLHFAQLIFIDLFRKYPAIQDLFKIKISSRQELDKNAHFQRQCAAYSNFLDYIVGFVHLNSGNFIEDACLQLGRCHAQQLQCRIRGGQILDEWWQAFIECTLFYLRPYFSKGSVFRRFVKNSYERAWRLLLTKITIYMKQGMREHDKGHANLQPKNSISPFLSQPPNRILELSKWLDNAQIGNHQKAVHDYDKKRRSQFEDEATSGISESEDSEDINSDRLSVGQLTVQTYPKVACVAKKEEFLPVVKANTVNLGNLEDWML